jgi:hypothetical protein
MVIQFIKRHKWSLIYITVIVCLCIICVKQINNHIYQEKKNLINIVALTDSIKYYQSKNNELVAVKTALELSFNELKVANEELYNKLQSIKVNNPEAAIDISTTIIHELHDTIWEIKTDSITKSFDFSNQYRELSGNVTKNSSTIGINFTKDIVNFDYTIAIKDNKIYLSSTNPYVKYNSISGYTIPKQKTKKWSIGPTISFGYDPIHNKFAPMVGVSITYGLIQW